MIGTAKLSRLVLVAAQAGLLLIGNAYPTYAASTTFTSAELSKIDSYERTIFGDTRKNMTPESRLRAIETNLFGTVKKGSIDSRLAAVQKSLGFDKAGGLAPPMAAQLDHLPVQSPPDSVPASQPDPVSPAADLLQDAMNQYSAGDVDTAEKTFKRVLTIDKNNADAYFNLGVIYEGKGDLSNALDNYQKAYALNPSDSELKNTVASVRSKLDQSRQTKIAQAQKEQQTLRQQQADAQKRETLRRTVQDASKDYKAGNFSEAARKLEVVARQAPTDPDVQYALGQAYKAKGDKQNARTAFNAALALDPNNQMYRTAINELDGGSLASAGGSSGSGSGSSGYGSSSYGGPSGKNADDGSPAGQITPFSGGGPGGGFGSMADRGYYNGGVSGYRSSRLKRTLTGSAVGAVTGGLFSAVSHSSVKSGIIRGALMGGMVGYFTSRF